MKTARSVESPATAETTAGPFPGLRPYEAEEAAFFFGRDAQVGELIGRLQRSCFLAVVGTSGSGKSSLVRAGLLPALPDGRFAQTSYIFQHALMRTWGVWRREGGAGVPLDILR